MNCSAPVVYANTFADQTAAISSTAVWTAPVDCVVRCTVGIILYASEPTVGVSGGISPNGPAPGVSSTFGDPMAVSFNAAEQITFVTAGTVMSVSSSVDIESGTLDHYDLHVTIEQLQ